MLYLRKEHLEQMIAHARMGAPREVCGVLAGRDGRVEKAYPAHNAERSRTRYRMVPREQLRIFLEVEERDWEILGIYHSHPSSPTYPSATDLELAFYPEAVYVIVSLVRGPSAQAFRIVDGEVSEVEMEVEER